MSSIGDVLNKVQKPRRCGNGWTALCPAATHGGDHNPSLSISIGESERILLTCHKGCEFEDIVSAIGFTSRELSGASDETDEEWTPFGPATGIYNYTDENGELLFQVLRTASKQFPTRVPDATAKNGWRWRLGDTRRVLFKLPELNEGLDAGKPTFLCEGEKDVLSAMRVGAVATCNPQGAGSWRDEFNITFTDAHVTIVADADEPGLKHARRVYAALKDIARYVRIVEPKSGKDLTDHLRAGHSLDDLVQITAPPANEARTLAPDIYEILNTKDEPYDWVVPELLERGDRLIITGIEGGGKSYLIRQLAAATAAGFHPFTFARIPQQKVLLIDCENSLRQTRRNLYRVEAAARKMGQPIPDGAFRILLRPEGIDLLRDDGDWLVERVIAHKPDILFIGPLYRLHSGNLNEETAARSITVVLDAARIQANCALVVEAHSGHGESGINTRSVRPIGSSLFLRWPEFGYGLRPAKTENGEAKISTVMDVVSWRGQRDLRFWPSRLRYGQDESWPWIEDMDSPDKWKGN